MKNNIGIATDKAAGLIKSLNELLSNYQIYYQNLKAYHWNIKGRSFFELHPKFEELYTAANMVVDELAERILTLGGQPHFKFSDYIAGAKIKEATDISNPQTTVTATIESIGTLLSLEREILKVASEADDEGTAALISEDIKIQEKTVWMLQAYLDN
ncbi:MAG: DNA starvation/stationary phase protection protein [Calditrichaeota bacterium]|nr:DNA starvation/stationary phase protection protein [Calditrichota bacterium]